MNLIYGVDRLSFLSFRPTFPWFPQVWSLKFSPPYPPPLRGYLFHEKFNLNYCKVFYIRAISQQKFNIIKPINNTDWLWLQPCLAGLDNKLGTWTSAKVKCHNLYQSVAFDTVGVLDIKPKYQHID